MPSDPFIGEITLMPYTFAPRNYQFCQGQLLSISSNTALFSLLGVTFGGNGSTTFGLPDLRGRVPVGSGSGPGLSTYTQGQTGGTETVTLLTTQIPAHTHALAITASNDPGDTSNPSAAYFANSGPLDKEYKAALTNQVTMGPVNTGATGGSQPHSNIQPYLSLNFCIATQGIFPSRP